MNLQTETWAEEDGKGTAPARVAQAVARGVGRMFQKGAPATSQLLERTIHTQEYGGQVKANNARALIVQGKATVQGRAVTVRVQRLSELLLGSWASAAD